MTISRSPSHQYRPEIDGLRAVAVVAVLINHLNPGWLPGGYLGVDLFFVISGYVVTGSLLGRQSSGARSFLLDFYRRRFRRLLPALIVTVLVVAVVFAALVSPGDGAVTPSLRSGIAALFGLSNLYFMRQGNDYFGADTHYNPFLHTWSLGVEEQFYLFWPWVLLLCGCGRSSLVKVTRRLGWWASVLSIASFLLLFWLHGHGGESAAFFLMPTRFWELAAGVLGLLWRGSLRPTLPSFFKSSWLSSLLLVSLVGVFFIPENVRLTATILCVVITTALLVLLAAERGPGLWLSKPLPLAIGIRSYSLYLWHWPVIVLARWSVGLQPITMLPVLALIALLTWLSYRLERHFRRPLADGRKGATEFLVGYPLLSLGAVAVISLLLGPARGLVFLGDRSRIGIDMANSRLIPGTSINTVNCFRDPTAPLVSENDEAACRAQPNYGRPTLYFEGDSHAESLIPMGEAILKSGLFNVGFFARGGCPVPSLPLDTNAVDRSQRYRLCAPDTLGRLERRIETMKPGDQLVLVSNLQAHFLSQDGSLRLDVSESHRKSIQELARRLDARGAGLILFAPHPNFTGRASLAVPPSLCLKEWYRPFVKFQPGCAPDLVHRDTFIQRLALIESYLRRLEGSISNMRVFHPFSIVCPPQLTACSTHRGDVLLMMDSNHLSREGVRLLEQPFLDFLQSPDSFPRQAPGRNVPGALDVDHHERRAPGLVR